MPNCGLLKITLASVFAILCSGAWEANALASSQGKLVTQAGTKQNSDYEAFRSFIKNAVGNPDYQVSYQVDMPGNPTEVVEQWLKGDKFRMDTQVQGNQARIYRVGQEVTNCITRGNNWNCFKLPNLDQVPASTVQGMQTLEDVENSPEQYRNQITKAGTRMVAGEPTTCFKVQQPEKNESFLSCYSNNHGIPLYMEGKNERGKWQMTATDFQTSVSDSAFSLPAEPQTIPGMPGGFQMPNR
ncbi:MAG: hypothetical protein ABEI32_16495 [Halothece sp.]